MTLRKLLLLMVGALALGSMILAACGSDDDDTNPVEDAGTSIAGGVDQGRTAVTGAITPGAGGGGAELKLVAPDTSFDKTELSAEAGEITISFDNQDTGVVHNVAVFEEKGDTKPIEATDLAPGPITQTLTLNLEKGEYHYNCQAHPEQMQGTLTVQ